MTRFLLFTVLSVLIALGCLWQGFQAMAPPPAINHTLTATASKLVLKSTDADQFSETLALFENQIKAAGGDFSETDRALRQLVESRDRLVVALAREKNNRQIKADDLPVLEDGLIGSVSRDEIRHAVLRNHQTNSSGWLYCAGVALLFGSLSGIEFFQRKRLAARISRLFPDAVGFDLIQQFAWVFKERDMYFSLSAKWEQDTLELNEEILKLQKQLVTPPPVGPPPAPAPVPSPPSGDGPSGGGAPVPELKKAITGKWTVVTPAIQDTEHQSQFFLDPSLKKAAITTDMGPVLTISVQNRAYLQDGFPGNQFLEVIAIIHEKIVRTILKQYKDARRDQFEVSEDAVFWMLPTGFEQVTDKIIVEIRQALSQEVPFHGTQQLYPKYEFSQLDDQKNKSMKLV